MNCTQFNQLLQNTNSGNETAPLSPEAEQHLQRCERCLSHWVEHLTSTAEYQPDDKRIVDTLLAMGLNPCGKAQLQLEDYLNHNLSRSSAELVDQHLQHCQHCAGLLLILANMETQLPSMAALEAPINFSENVIALTTGPNTEQRTQEKTMVVKLLKRPRFAMEGAYLATLLWVFLLGVPAVDGMPINNLEQFIATASNKNIAAGEVIVDKVQWVNTNNQRLRTQVHSFKKTLQQRSQQRSREAYTAAQIALQNLWARVHQGIERVNEYFNQLIP